MKSDTDVHPRAKSGGNRYIDSSPHAAVEVTRRIRWPEFRAASTSSRRWLHWRLRPLAVLVYPAFLLVALAATLVRAQGSGDVYPSDSIDQTFYRSFTLAPAEESTPGGGGDDPEQRTAALARAAQNPVANLITVPFQNNFNFGIGPNDVTQWVLNVQPVIPITLNDEWNLITRTIMPIINQPSPAPGVSSAFGLGDINPSFFLSPGKPGKFIWGAGPTFTFPTATDSELGSGKYSAGPALVGLMVEGHWVVGALVNNQWSYAGWRDQNVNAMTLQYFVNYNLPKGWYLTSAPIITANWKADSSERWTVPVGAGVGKIVHLGKLPLNVQLSGYYNAEKPETFGADWQLRFQVQFLFPK